MWLFGKSVFKTVKCLKNQTIFFRNVWVIILNPLKPNVLSKGHCDNCNKTRHKIWYTKLSVFFDQDDRIVHRTKKNSILSNFQAEQWIFQDWWHFKCHFLFWNFYFFINATWKPCFLSDIAKRVIRLSDETIPQSFNWSTDKLWHHKENVP
jgi:hypothetical protein